jgi:hypothetical protein
MHKDMLPSKWVLISFWDSHRRKACQDMHWPKEVDISELEVFV